MRPEPATPPAHVHEHNREARLKAIVAEINNSERMNVRRAHEAGLILDEIFAACKHGEWGGKLASLGIDHQRASEWRRLAKVPAPALSAFDSIRSALDSIKEDEPKAVAPKLHEPTAEPDVYIGLASADNGDDTFLKPVPIIPKVEKVEVIFCKRCQRMRFAVKDCQGCKNARSDADRKAREKPKGKSKGRPAPAVIHFKDVDREIGRLVRWVDEIEPGKETPLGEGCRRLLSELTNAFRSLFKKFRNG